MISGLLNLKNKIIKKKTLKSEGKRYVIDVGKQRIKRDLLSSPPSAHWLL